MNRIVGEQQEGTKILPCDKTGPGALMGAIRLNYPTLMVCGGTIAPGYFDGQELTIVDGMIAEVHCQAGLIDRTKCDAIVRHACPGAGGCGGMFTYNTWALMMEAMGFVWPGTSVTPAESTDKDKECEDVGRQLRIVLGENPLGERITPKMLLSRQSLRNAAVMLAAVGGSTNGILHLLALAREAKIPFSLADFKEVFQETPLLWNFSPRTRGKTVLALHQMGGSRVVMKQLLEGGKIDGSCLTVTGHCLSDNYQDDHAPTPDHEFVWSFDNPLKPTADLATWSGSLCPEGAVSKISTVDAGVHILEALCFDREEEFAEYAKRPDAADLLRKKVIVIRYEGPKGGPGMREMLYPTVALLALGLAKETALITDGRFSGGFSGFIVGHICPEAAVGGPIAALRDGDWVQIDLDNHTLHLLNGKQGEPLSEAEISMRLATLPPWQLSADELIVLRKYSEQVGSASFGAVTL